MNLLRCVFNESSQAVIDLLIPGQTPGIKERLVDLYGKPELLFFGPDGSFSSSYCTYTIVMSRSRGYRGYDGLGSM